MGVPDDKIKFDWRITQKELNDIVAGKAVDGMESFKRLTDHTPGDIVRRKRRRLRLTQAQLAKMRGVSLSFIKKIEQGVKPVPKLLQEWAKRPI